MQITFLGTGTSVGVPVIGCDCEVCRSDDPHDKRQRSSLWLRFDDGRSVLVDASPDLRAQALRFRIPRVDAIILTHAHADHILGLDDVRIYNFRQRAAIPLYGAERALTQVRRMFAYAFDAAAQKGGGIPQFDVRTLTGPFTLGDVSVLPVPILHGRLPVLGFRMGNFAYLTDCNHIPENSWPLLENLDILVLDALRHKPHPTHFTLAEAIETARLIGARQTWFTHMTCHLPHAQTCAELPDGMSLAWDGLELDVAVDAAPDAALVAAAADATGDY